MFSESSIILIKKSVTFLRLLGPFPYVWDKQKNTINVTSARRRFTQNFTLHYPLYVLYTLYQLQMEWSKPESDIMTLYWLIIFATGYILCWSSVDTCATKGKEQVQLLHLVATFYNLPHGK